MKQFSTVLGEGIKGRESAKTDQQMDTIYDRTLGARTDEIRAYIAACGAVIEKHRALNKGAVQLRACLLDQQRASADLEQVQPVEACLTRECTLKQFQAHLTAADEEVRRLLLGQVDLW